MTKNNAISAVVIPARLASTRLKQKLLLNATGRPLIQHTYQSAQTAKLPSLVCVATEDEEIRQAVVAFGGNCVMTSAGLNSGTERVAEVAAAALAHVDIVVNVQGDEPEIAGAAIDQLVTMLEDDPTTDVATLATPIRNEADLRDPSCVKVVSDHTGRAIYFSRSAIPHPRDGVSPEMFGDAARFYQHVGIYAYRRDFLLRWADLPLSPLEQIECLEQLRVLSAGVDIRVGFTGHAARGIDTLENYQRFVASQRRQRGSAA